MNRHHMSFSPPSRYRSSPLRHKFDQLVGTFHRMTRSSGYELAKRICDLAGAILLLIFAAPAVALIMLAIKLDDGGPIFYWQQRVGRYGRVFRFPKFRSMHTNADQVRAKLVARNQHGESITFKMKDDPRITRVGRVLRRLSLDELPQVWCVLNGTMSLVGPRPPLPSEVAAYSLSQRRRLDVQPGLTCLWQVKGRADVPFHGQVLLDIEYIESQSLFLDLHLLLTTIPAVMKGRGAY